MFNCTGVDVLQDLLNLGLVDIGGDDTRFSKMESAAKLVANAMATDPNLVVIATLCAIDADIDADDPLLVEIERHVSLEWKTLRNTHQNRPKSLLRSIAIAALKLATDENSDLRSIVWYIAESYIEHSQTSLGREKDLIIALLRACQKDAEERASPEVLAPAIDKRKTRAPLQIKNILEFTIADDEYQLDVAKASGPQYPQGVALTGANPHWPGANTAWSLVFSPLLAKTLAKVSNTLISKANVSLTAEITKIATALEKRTTEALSVLDASGDAVAENATRLTVLWWVHARYSPTRRLPYRKLTAVDRAIAMAQDLAAIVPTFAPLSAQHILYEAVSAFPIVKNSALTLEAILAQTTTTVPCQWQDLRSNATQRVPLMTLVGTKIKGGDLRKRAGIDPELKLSMGDFSVWIFRELQASKIMVGLK